MTALLAAISYVLAFLEFPVPLSPSFARMDVQTLNVGARDDTNACDGGHAGCSNSGVQAGAVLLGRIEISEFSSRR